VKPFNLGLPDASEAISSHGQQQQLSEEVIVKQRLASPFPRFSVFLWAMKRSIVISHDFHFSLCHSADAYIAAAAPAPAHGLRDIEETSHPSSSTAETVRGKSFKSGSVLVEPFY